MDNKEKIQNLLTTINQASGEVRSLIEEEIKKDIRLITGTDEITLSEFHQEDGVSDLPYILVEVDRHTGDMGYEIVDSVSIKNSKIYVDTEYGGEYSNWVALDDLVTLYEELEYIVSVKDAPNWDFKIEDSKIVLKDE